jgi:hypothetical protein
MATESTEAHGKIEVRSEKIIATGANGNSSITPDDSGPAFVGCAMRTDSTKISV